MRNNNLSKSRGSKTHLCAVAFTTLTMCLNLKVQFNPYQSTGFEMQLHEILNLCKIGICH